MKMHWLDEAFIFYIRREAQGDQDKAAACLQMIASQGNSDYLTMLCAVLKAKDLMELAGKIIA